MVEYINNTRFPILVDSRLYKGIVYPSNKIEVDDNLNVIGLDPVSPLKEEFEPLEHPVEQVSVAASKRFKNRFGQ